MRWAEYVARTEGEEKCMQRQGGKTWQTGHLEDLGIDGSIILECILKKRLGGRGVD